MDISQLTEGAHKYKRKIRDTFNRAFRPIDDRYRWQYTSLILCSTTTATTLNTTGLHTDHHLGYTVSSLAFGLLTI